MLPRRSFTLPARLAVAALVLTLGACAHSATKGTEGAAGADTLEPDRCALPWARTVAGLVAEESALSVQLGDAEVSQLLLDRLAAGGPVVHVLLRSVDGQPLAQWGTLPERISLPDSGQGPLQELREGHLVLRNSILSGGLTPEPVGEVLLVARGELATCPEAWPEETARQLASLLRLAVEFEDEDGARVALGGLRHSQLPVFALVRKADGSELARWGRLPAGLEVPPAEMEAKALRNRQEGWLLLRTPVRSTKLGKWVGDLVLIAHPDLSFTEKE